MLHEIVTRQQEEKLRHLSRQYIRRIKEREAAAWIDSTLIKVITGPRRAGKSVFSFMLLEQVDFGYFNFDEEALSNSKKLDTNDLMNSIHAVYGDVKTLFFDEIQNLEGWELFVNRLQRQGYNLVITGSNSRLLSRELATSLTGRHIPITILPFSFREFVLAQESSPKAEQDNVSLSSNQIQQAAGIFLRQGGFPEIIMSNLDGPGYLRLLFDSVLFKDIARRFRIRQPEQMDVLGNYLTGHCATLFTNRKLAAWLGLKSDMTVEKYLRYLMETYMIYVLERYSFKAKERHAAPKKVYVVDNGLVAAKSVNHSQNSGPMLENMIFTELIKTGLEANRELFYYQTKNNREVDFVIRKANVTTELIQVAYDVSHPGTLAREVRAMTEAARELDVDRLTLVTWADQQLIHEGTHTIRVIPAWAWMRESDR